MKILKLSPYCFPEEVSSSHLGRDLNEAYSKAGICIENYVPTPTRGIDKETRKKYKKIRYEEQYDGHLIIHRFALFREGKNPLQRAFRYIICNIIQYYKGINAKNIDLVFCGSTPPTQGIVCTLVSKKLSKKYKKKVPLVYNLQDVFPDSLVNAKMTTKGSLIWKIGRGIENYIYKNVDHIIVISNSIKLNIIKKGVSEDKISVIPNWINTEIVKPVNKNVNRLFAEFSIPKEKFIVLYAGNFGSAQGADVVIEAAKILKDNEQIQFVIFGGGSNYSMAVENAKNMNNVIIHPLLPQERVAEVYSLGDVALITCKKGTGNAGMPSKTWSIMACNTPIIASFDVNSELNDILLTANAGKCIEPENAALLAENILDLFKYGGTKYCGGRMYVDNNISKNKCVNEYLKILSKYGCK